MEKFAEAERQCPGVFDTSAGGEFMLSHVRAGGFSMEEMFDLVAEARALCKGKR